MSLNPQGLDTKLIDTLRAGVSEIDARVDKPWDRRSDQALAGAYLLSVAQGFTGGDDVRVAVNHATPTRAAGESLMVARVGPNASPDPFENRAHMPMQQVLDNDPNVFYAKASSLQLERQQAVQSERQQTQTVDGLSKS